MTSLPPLPKIDSDVDLMLDVYSHSSLNVSPDVHMKENYGDTLRVEDLGAQVLNLAITVHLHNERPMLNFEEIRARRNQLTDFATINTWLDSYELKRKLRIPPSEVDAVLSAPGEMTKYFHKYVGAVYICHGQETVQNWISRLIDPSTDVNMSTPPRADGHAQQPQPGHQNQPPMYGQPQNQYSHHYGHAYSYPSPPQNPHYLPAPPSSPPPPLPGNPQPSVGLSLVNLALVNQTASQRGFQVMYPAEQVGPPHQPTWTVRCCMNGEEKGRGVGKSQKLAKEEAARQAWVAMGWGS